eukprot:scaffold31492_cov45-Isochrysis_galbana.AAC.1
MPPLFPCRVQVPPVRAVPGQARALPAPGVGWGTGHHGGRADQHRAYLQYCLEQRGAARRGCVPGG